MSFLAFEKLPDSSTLTGIVYANGASAPTATALAANQFFARSSAGAAGAKTITDAGLAILDDANAAAQRTTLGIELTSGQILVGNASNNATPTGVSGDATISNTGVLTIASSAVSNAKMANMSANTVKVNATAGAAAPTDIALSVNQFLARSSAGNITQKTITDFAFTFLDDANAAAVRTTLGIQAGGVTNINAADSPYSQLVTDNGKLLLVDDSSGAVTINLLAAATAGAGFYCWIKKTSASNYVLIAPNGTELVDDRGSGRLISKFDAVGLYCDGSNWHVFDAQYVRRRVIYSSTGANTFTTLNEVPLGCAYIRARVWGSGSSGAISASGSIGGTGGAGGGYTEEILAVSALGASQTVTIGAGGAGVSGSGTSGNAGNTSSFGAFCSASGGAAPTGGSVNAISVGGVGSGGDLNYRGGYGSTGDSAGGAIVPSRAGGSPLGGGSTASFGTTVAGAYPGGGSPGATTAHGSGDGAAGLAIIEML